MLFCTRWCVRTWCVISFSAHATNPSLEMCVLYHLSSLAPPNILKIVYPFCPRDPIAYGCEVHDMFIRFFKMTWKRKHEMWISSDHTRASSLYSELEYDYAQVETHFTTRLNNRQLWKVLKINVVIWPVVPTLGWRVYRADECDSWKLKLITFSVVYEGD